MLGCWDLAELVTGVRCCRLVAPVRALVRVARRGVCACEPRTRTRTTGSRRSRCVAAWRVPCPRRRVRTKFSFFITNRSFRGGKIRSVLWDSRGGGAHGSLRTFRRLGAGRAIGFGPRSCDRSFRRCGVGNERPAIIARAADNVK